MIKTLFTFIFNNEDTNRLTAYQFNISGERDIYVKFFQNYENMEDKAMNMEVFGIHDVSVAEGELEGFTSYEVDPEDYLNVMNDWNKWFGEQGFTVGEVMKVKHRGGYAVRTKEQKIHDKEVWVILDEIRNEVFSNKL
jgi:hypothetical protein